MKRQCVIGAIALCSLIMSGCISRADIKNEKEKNHGQSEESLEKSEELENEWSDHMENQEIEDQIDTNTKLVLSYMDVSEDGVKGCMRRLQQLGCGKLVKVEITDAEECYSLTLIDENDQKYYITLGYDGYLGIIKDGEGNYLYAPVD